MSFADAPADSFVFGGVDSRSNPLTLSPDRSLRCLNWVPCSTGIELRRGYSEPATSGAAPNQAIHSIIPYEMWTGTRYLLIGASTKLYSLNLATGVWVLLSSSLSGNKLDYFPAQGQVHIVDGVQVWFFDGTTLRKSGIRSLTDAEAKAVTVNIGTSLPDVSGVTLAFNAGGAWPGSDAYGVSVYGAIWDPTAGTISPAVLINATPIKGAATQKLDAASLPVLTGGKLWSLLCTADGGSTPKYISARGSAHAPTCLPYSGFSAMGTTVTITSVAHGLTTGRPVAMYYSISYGAPAVYQWAIVKATVIDANHFSIPWGIWHSHSLTIVSLYELVTGATVADNSYGISASASAQTAAGFPASTVGGAQPGYQAYACIWNPTTKAVGNRTKIGLRIKPASPSTIVIGSLPDLSSENSECQILIGSTIDGGETPYLMVDAGGNFLSVASGATSTNVDGGYVLDPTSEMPYRNGIAPALKMACTIGDQALGCTGADAYVYVSASQLDPIHPQIVGVPEQSWAPNDVLQFPTREVPTCIQEWNQVALVMSRNYSAPLVNIQGVWDFGQGFPIGCAGQRAFTKSLHGPFWITGQKQLATIGPDSPVPISGEYEAALLSLIGDAYLGETEIIPCVDVAKRKDELIIKCRDANGNPFEIVHDFMLGGQAYVRKYVGALATNYILASGIDSNGIQRPYAGANTGKVYLEESGYSDNGAEFSADYIGLINLGPKESSLSEISLWGDLAATLSISRYADGTGGWELLPTGQHKGDGDHDFRNFHQVKDGEIQFCYLRLQLASHSADAPAAELNDPPHYPLEDYGKVYMARYAFGVPRR